MKTINFKQTAFTLIELIIVIVLLSVVAVSIANIFRDTTEGFLQSDARQSLFANARLSVERIGREVREAVPNSVRVNAANSCVEFVPIVAATQYINLPTTTAAAQMTVVEQDANTLVSSLATSNLYVMVMTLNEDEVYNTVAGHVAQVSSIAKLGSNQTQINFTANVQFNQLSPQDRVFFVRQPVSFCVSGSNLNRYTGYGFSTIQPAIASLGTGSLLIDNALLVVNGNPVTLFQYFSGTLNRSALLLIDLHLSGRDESINLEHEIHVRNFP